MNRLIRDAWSGLLATGLAVAILAFPGATARAQQAAAKTAPTGNADIGKKLYISTGCYQCHGYAAHGGAGARLAPKPIAYQGFLNYVRKPIAQMPGYSTKVLKDADIADIYAFLQTIPEPPKLKDIPLLNGE